MGGLKLITPAAAKPISLDEVRTHLRLTSADEDGYLELLIGATTRAVEQSYRVALLAQTWELALDAAPACPEIDLPPSPLQSVTSVTSYDEANVATVMASSLYVVDTYRTPGRVVLTRDAVWPTALRVANGIVIRFVAGLAPTADLLPADLKLGLLAVVGSLYEERLPVHEVTGQTVERLCSELLASYRTMRL